MKHELKYTTYLVCLTAIAGLLAFFLTPYAVVDNLEMAQANPWVVLGVVVVSMTLGTFAFLKLQKNFEKWFDAIMIFLLTDATLMFTNMFIETTAIQSAIQFAITFTILYWGLLKPMQKDDENIMWAAHFWNFFILFAFVGIGLKLGLLLPLWASITFLAVAAIYDWWAVYKTKHMVSLAKGFVNRRLVPGFFLRKRSGKFALLGGGDIFFIVMLTAGLHTISATMAAFGLTGMLIGLIVLFAISSEKKFYPAIPPIAIGLVVGICLWLYGVYLFGGIL